MPSSACLPLCVLVYLGVRSAGSAFCCRKLNKAAALPASKVALKRKHQQHRLLAAAWVNKNKKNMHGSVRAALEPWAWVGAKCKLQSAAHRTLLIQLNPHPAANWLANKAWPAMSRGRHCLRNPAEQRKPAFLPPASHQLRGLTAAC